MIETLHETGRRLEELTAGEVDTVADRDGRTFLLRRAQDHLRRNEAAKQAAILNALPASIALLDRRGIIISVNEAWRRFAIANALQGPQYGSGVNYLEVCDRARGDGASQARQAAAGIRSVLGGGVKSFAIEYACHSPAQQRWFLMTATPLADDHPNGAVVMHLDVTAQRQTEESLRASELRFREMAENIREVFWLTDPVKSQILYLSPAYEEIWGRSREGVYASPRDWIEAIHPDDRERVLHAAQTKQAGDKYVEEYRIVRPDGAIRWIRDRAFPVLRDDGEVYRIAGLAEDITESRRVTEELRESERRFSGLLRNVELVSLMIDREARITYCNKYLLRLTGWRREEVIGRNWFELFVPPELGDLKDGFFAALLANQPETWHHENEILTRSGGRRLIRWNNSVLRSAAGEVTGIAGIGEDITERKRAEEALRESEHMLRAIFEGALDGILVADVQAGKFLAANPAICGMLGYTQKEIVRIGVPDIHLKQDLPHVTEQLGKLLHGETQTSADIRVMRKDGSVFYADIKAASIRLGGKDCLLGIFRDITERKQAHDRIAYLNRVYAMLSGINTLIVRVRDRDELFREACRIAVEAGGFRMSLIGIVDRSSMQVVPLASAGKDAELLNAIKVILASSENAPNTMIAQAIRKKEPVVSNDSRDDPRVLFGKQYALSGVRSMVILPLMVSNEAVGVLALYAGESEFFHAGELKLLTELASDIAFAIDHIEKEEKLNYLAYYDVLTGLANRSLFLERVAQYMRSAVGGGHKLALFLIDLERFKNINDSLGRPAGDALLRQVAAWLTSNVGDASLLARLGADHFAVVLPQVKQEGDVARLLEKTMAAFLEHPFRLNDAVFRVAVKVGIALFPDDGDSADTLFRNAEAALKKAKAGGDRYLFYTQTMTAAVAGRLTLENQLRRALDQEEFVLHFQPKVNLASGKLTSAEALIRWNDPRTGLVPPGRFIPILEETGLIYDVGRWALKKAIEDYLRWRAAGLPAVRIAVNVSPLQLRNRGFVDEISQVIGIEEHAAAGLELEITESLIMENVKHNIASLQAIRQMGVRIAIDDFGTGFSSLSYLAKLPVDTLKIDRSFVTNMTAEPEGLALVSTIINLAHSLELKVVAEGVETEEQSRLLRLLKCDEMQGFVFSKPVPSDIFETKFLTPSPAG